jgi:hypothetical protein
MARKVSSRNLTFTPLDSAISLLKIIKTRSLYEERKNIKTTIRIKNNNLISWALAEIISPTKYSVLAFGAMASSQAQIFFSLSREASKLGTPKWKSEAK